MTGLKLTLSDARNQTVAPSGPGFMESTALAFRQAQDFEERGSQSRLWREALEPFTEFLNHHGVPVAPVSVAAPDVDYTFEAMDRLREQGVAIPDALSVGKSRFRDEVLEGARAKYGKRAQQLASGSAVGAFIGGAAAGVDDLENVLTLPFGAPARSTVLGAAFLEGLVGGGTEVVANRNRERFIRQLGGAGASDLEAFGLGFAGGAITGGGIKATIVGGKRVAQYFGGRKKMAEEIKAGAPVGSDARTAAEAVLDDIEGEESSRAPQTLTGLAEHRERASRAARDLEEGRPPAIPDEAAQPRPVAAEPVISRDSTRLFRPDQLNLNPERWQFKSDADELGRTEKLRGVTEWRPERSGILMGYEYLDGTVDVTDGHQRVNLARALEGAGHDPIELRVFVQREADGITVEEARVTAAMKNIAEAAEGLTTARAKDAAKILRVAPEEIANLPAGPGIVRARELSQLSDDAFGLYINEVVPERFAAAVGRIAANRPELHADLVRVLERTEPQTIEQAESVIRQALESPRRTETTADLFGEETNTRSLYLEKAKVLERALQLLRKDRQVFGTLVKERARIEGKGGNKLAAERNAEIRQEVDNAIAQISKLAHRRGEIGDALNRAAERYADSGRLGDAASGFSADILGAIQGGRLAGDGHGGLGRGGEPTAPAPDGAEPGLQVGEEFGEVGGPGQQRQAEELMPRRQRTPAQVKNGFEGDADRRAAIQELLDKNAPRDEIDNHPVVVEALKRAEELPETRTFDGYGLDTWHQARTYDFDGEDVTGTAAALPKWVERAKRLAAEETRTPFRGVDENAEAVIILGPPAAGKSTIANEIALARRAAIVDSDDIKKTIPEFEGGLGANAVHEESGDLSGLLLEAMVKGRSNIVLPKVGASHASIANAIKRLKAEGYKVELVNMDVTPDRAYSRMMRRFVKTGRLVSPKYLDHVGSKPRGVFRQLKKEGAADGFAEIDNNGDLGAVPEIRELAGSNPLAGSSYDFGRGGRAGAKPGGDKPGAPVDTRQLQTGVATAYSAREPGAAAGSDPAARLRAEPASPDGAQRAAPSEADIRVDHDSVPVGVRMGEDGEISVDVASARELGEELDADDEFAEQLGACLV